MLVTMKTALLVICSLGSLTLTLGAIRDPMNFFCGSYNCYDVLEVNRTIESSAVKSAYRKAAVKYHPDKNRAKNATAVFRLVEKAYKVLSDKEKRELFDYYLDHPRAYYKVTGHYIYNLPKSNVGIVVALVVVLLSVLTHYTQLHKHENIKKQLRETVLAYTSNQERLKALAGEQEQVQQIQQLIKDSTSHFEELFKESMATKNIKKAKVPGINKMVADPLYAKAVHEVVDNVEFEGGARKPQMEDLFAYRLVMWPYGMYQSWSDYYRYEVKGDEPSEEKKVELAARRLGLGTWHDLKKEQQDELLKRGVYKQAVADEWQAEQDRAVEIARQVAKEKRRRRYKNMGYESDEIEELLEG